jgi:hypothetical protein
LAKLVDFILKAHVHLKTKNFPQVKVHSKVLRNYFVLFDLLRIIISLFRILLSNNLLIYFNIQKYEVSKLGSYFDLATKDVLED